MSRIAQKHTAPSDINNSMVIFGDSIPKCINI